MRIARKSLSLSVAKDVSAHIRGLNMTHGLALLGFTCLLALALVTVPASKSRATVDLQEFTATTQADGSILLRWVTRTELDTSSFRVYRAQAATGPWNTEVNKQDSTSDGVTDTVYEYNDTDVAVGITYYYVIEEVEVGTTGGVNLYTDFIRSATAGQLGAPTSTPTATSTVTPISTQGASLTPSRTPTPTTTWTVAAAATDAPTDAPTATGQSTNTPLPQGQPQPTASLTVPPSLGANRGTATATLLPAARVTTPTGQAGSVPAPATPTSTRPSAVTPAVGGAASATPSRQPTFTPTINPQRVPTATPSPAIYAAKATAQPVLRGAATRPSAAETDADSAVRNDGWILAVGGGAVILAALLGGIALFLWRQRRS